jgi:hypothetical protein
VVTGAVYCITCCLTSLRGTAKGLCLMTRHLCQRVPAWTSVQNWVLRFGLYVLRRPLPRRPDWVLILDEAVNLGTQKLLLVLAVSLQTLRERRFQLCHQDLQVVALATAEHCDGTVVKRVLADVAGRIGGIAQVVTDGGSNLKRGIRLFQKRHPATLVTSDITHATARLLKGLFELDPRFRAFTSRLTEVRRQTAQTEFACLAPPSPRAKSRWLNLDLYLGWAQRLQQLRATPQARGRPSRRAAQEWAARERRFAWLDGFQADLERWNACLSLVTAANRMVKCDGLTKESPARFRAQLSQPEKLRGKARQLAGKITAFLQQQAARLPDAQPWLGTSDIIESIFGKYKLFTARTALPELGKAVLVIPALTAKLDPREITAAMATVSTRDVRTWLAENIGYSLMAKRNRLLGRKKPLKRVNGVVEKPAKVA